MASSFMKIIYNMIALPLPVQRELWREFGQKRQGQNRFRRYRCIHGNELTQGQAVCSEFSSTVITSQRSKLEARGPVI